MQNQDDRTVNHQMQTQLKRTFYMPLTRMGIFLSTIFSKLSSVRGDVSLVRVGPQLSGEVRSLAGSGGVSRARARVTPILASRHSDWKSKLTAKCLCQTIFEFRGDCLFVVSFNSLLFPRVT